MSALTEPASAPAQLALELPAPPATAETPLLPVRMVNEWVYCPRLAFLEWVDGEWADSGDTEEGRRAHVRVDAGGGQLPAPAQAEDKPDFVARSVTLASEKLGIIAKMDLGEGEDGTVTPVDTKKGKRPHVPEGAYEPERVQICAQALILEDAGYTVPDGAIWYAGSPRGGHNAPPAKLGTVGVARRLGSGPPRLDRTQERFDPHRAVTRGFRRTPLPDFGARPGGGQDPQQPRVPAPELQVGQRGRARWRARGAGAAGGPRRARPHHGRIARPGRRGGRPLFPPLRHHAGRCRARVSRVRVGKAHPAPAGRSRQCHALARLCDAHADLARGALGGRLRSLPRLLPPAAVRAAGARARHDGAVPLDPRRLDGDPGDQQRGGEVRRVFRGGPGRESKTARAARLHRDL